MGGLIFVGLGLAGLNDVTLRGLDAIRSADVVYAEFYTSRLMGVTVQDLRGLSGKPVHVLKREDVERHADLILHEAKTKLVAFLVVGDAMSATTHEDLRGRAEADRIPTRVIPGISIFTVAPALAGLQMYKMGRATTIPFPHGAYMPESPYDVIRENRARGLHTLVLLDIDAEHDRYMTATEAVEILRGIEEKRGEQVIPPDQIIVGIARAGSPDQILLCAAAKDWGRIDLGPPLQCLIVPGTLHFMEEEALAKLRQAAASTRSV